ncbi:unnamed protein product [Pylaiella littoralis]
MKHAAVAALRQRQLPCLDESLVEITYCWRRSAEVPFSTAASCVGIQLVGLRCLVLRFGCGDECITCLVPDAIVSDRHSLLPPLNRECSGRPADASRVSRV